MRLARAIWRWRRGRVLLGALACYLLWHAWLTVRAPGKIAPDLSRPDGGTVDVLVVLPFPPERFHVLAFQKYGRVSGTEDTRVELRGVRPADLRAVARPYWVSRVEPIRDEQRR